MNEDPHLIFNHSVRTENQDDLKMSLKKKKKKKKSQDPTCYRPIVATER